MCYVVTEEGGRMGRAMQSFSLIFSPLQIANHTGYIKVDWQMVERDVSKAKEHLKFHSGTSNQLTPEVKGQMKEVRTLDSSIRDGVERLSAKPRVRKKKPCGVCVIVVQRGGETKHKMNIGKGGVDGAELAWLAAYSN